MSRDRCCPEEAGASTYRTAANLHRKQSTNIADYSITARFLNIELRYLWLDAGLKGAGVPKYRKAKFVCGK